MYLLLYGLSTSRETVAYFKYFTIMPWSERFSRDALATQEVIQPYSINPILMQPGECLFTPTIVRLHISQHSARDVDPDLCVRRHAQTRLHLDFAKLIVTLPFPLCIFVLGLTLLSPSFSPLQQQAAEAVDHY